MAAMFWQVSLLILLIGTIDWLTRKWIWPQVRYALWLMVFVKLILPPSLAIPTSVTSQILPFIEGRIFAKDSHLFKPNMPIKGRLSRIDDFEKTTTLRGGNQTGKIVVTRGALIEFLQKLTWQAFAMAAWLLGMLLLTGCGLFKLRRLRRLHPNVLKEKSMPDWFGPLLSQCAARLKLSKIPDVITTDEVQFPAVFGLFKPTILLPVNYANKNSRKNIENILLHELAHIKRVDLFVHAVQFTLQTVYWFNPRVWSVRKQVQHLREICCDATVARILRGNTSNYRQTLLKSARELLAVNMEPEVGLLGGGIKQVSHFNCIRRCFSMLTKAKMLKSFNPTPLGIFEDSNRLAVRMKWLEKNTWRYQWLKSMTVFCLATLLFFYVLPMARAGKKEVLEISNTHKNPLRNELGALNINKEIQTMKKANVKRRGSKVWIEGVDKLAGWGNGEENTFIGSLRVALSAVGENVPYDQLMGPSGAAFRLQIAQPEWCASAPDAQVGFEISGPARKTLGYSLKISRIITYWCGWVLKK
ncbi:MAG: M56 family metallopeptidase [bacterium]